MKTIVLVGCGKMKLPKAAPAKDLYIGPLFKKARAYAEAVGDEWAILSAKHGLVLPDTMIEPYDETMDQKTKLGRTFWGATVLRQVASNWIQSSTIDGPEFICLAGAPYLEFWDMDPDIRTRCTIKKPLEGLGIGERQQFLDAALEEISQRDHDPVQGLLFNP